MNINETLLSIAYIGAYDQNKDIYTYLLNGNRIEANTVQ